VALEAQEFRRIMKNFILLFILLFICSCSLKKNVLPEGIKKYSAKKVLRNANKTKKNFKNLQTKAKVTINNKGKDKSNNLNIRISKDEQLWANAALGAVRFLIDNDSIKFYNKLEKKYLISDFSYFNREVGLDVDFKTLQRLILGEILPGISFKDFKGESEYGYSFKTSTDVLNKSSEVLVTLSPYNFNVLSYIFYDGTNKIFLTYDSFNIINGSQFPEQIRLFKNGEILLKIEFRSLSLVEKINMPFKIPNNYKAILQ
tara:strand:- start:5438 stop:6214 length:777 start_codon:yes stop_codon:yes gene_type:complete